MTGNNSSKLELIWSIGFFSLAPESWPEVMQNAQSTFFDEILANSLLFPHISEHYGFSVEWAEGLSFILKFENDKRWSSISNILKVRYHCEIIVFSFFVIKLNNTIWFMGIRKVSDTLLFKVHKQVKVAHWRCYWVCGVAGKGTHEEIPRKIVINFWSQYNVSGTWAKLPVLCSDRWEIKRGVVSGLVFYWTFIGIVCEANCSVPLTILALLLWFLFSTLSNINVIRLTTWLFHTICCSELPWFPRQPLLRPHSVSSPPIPMHETLQESGEGE